MMLNVFGTYHIAGGYHRAWRLALLSFLANGCTSVSEAGLHASAPPLTRTDWRLVHFESSDDTIGTIRPNHDEVFTLQLVPDGGIVMQLSCNRGGGEWKSHDFRRGQGSIALTMGFSSPAACPPGRFDNLTTRLGDVRTFVIRDGRLHLNLKMDGATTFGGRNEPKPGHRGPGRRGAH